MPTVSEPEVDIDEMFRLGTPIDEAIDEAIRDAIEEHRQTGIPLVCWRNGRIVYVDPFTDQEVPTLARVPRPAGF